MKKLMHFTADWCLPCKQMKPIIEEFRFTNKDVEYHNINVDLLENLELVKDFEILGVPTLIVLTDNQVTNRHTGLANKDKLESLIS
jgi:thioredoxin 1